MLATAQFSPRPSFESDEVMAARLKTLNEDIAEQSVGIRRDHLYSALKEAQENSPLLQELRSLMHKLDHSVRIEEFVCGDSPRFAFQLRLTETGFGIVHVRDGGKLQGEFSFERSDFDNWMDPPTPEEVLDKVRSIATEVIGFLNGEVEVRGVMARHSQLRCKIEKLLKQKPS